MFKPNLPAPKQRAIEGIAFGTVNKIFLEFPHKFWPDDWTGFTLLWREEELNEIKGTDKEWLEDVFGFYIVNYQPNILASWIIGPHGRYMETLDDNEILDGLMWLLKKFLSFPVPTPSNFKTTKWYSNSNFRGSYSFRSLRTEELDTCAYDLSVPLTEISSGKPVLQFAGEASSEHFYSTVHGAVEAEAFDKATHHHTASHRIE
uniref:Amine oxidase domain-containing protein n=1 Tax=Megaselia scalaris TaxID=36166 RepID=T1H026_MEGSC